MSLCGGGGLGGGGGDAGSVYSLSDASELSAAPGYRPACDKYTAAATRADSVAYTLEQHRLQLEATIRSIDNAQAALLNAVKSHEGEKLANEVRTVFEDFTRKSGWASTETPDRRRRGARTSPPLDLELCVVTRVLCGRLRVACRRRTGGEAVRRAGGWRLACRSRVSCVPRSDRQAIAPRTAYVT